MAFLESSLPSLEEDRSRSSGWAQKELSSLAGHDVRLVKRLAIMLEDWAAQPQASIPESSRSAAAVKASYRLLANKRMKASDIEEGHRQATWRRMTEQPLVLAVADTTSLNHTSHPKSQGLGPIGQGNGSAQGFFLHSVLAFGETGESLGVLHTQCWARSQNPGTLQERKATKNSRALDQRESQRWTAAYEAVVGQFKEQQSLHPSGQRPRLIMVTDREGDIYELFCSNMEHDSQCGLLVRAMHPRRLAEDGQILWSHLENQPEHGRLELEVPGQEERKSRTATLALRSAPVKLGVPRDKAKMFKASRTLELWAIEAREINPPEELEPLHWKLLSSTPAADSTAAERQLKWYAKRWGIEVFHRTLKSGCQSERRQLRSLEKLQCALSLDIIVAWRLMALRDAAREHPISPAAQWLEPAECEVLTAWAKHKHRQSPKEAEPSIHEAVRWIARLGGYLDRKNDPPPGVQVLWRGLGHLHDMTQTWLLAKTCGQ